MTSENMTVSAADGRSLDVLLAGAPDDLTLVYHSGTPSGAAPHPILERAAGAQGMRVVTWSRPGYGSSTPQPGRSVAAVVEDASAVCEAVGIDRFVTLGYSGGGPHALACAALMADRCVAAASLAGVAPHQAEGLDWSAGMGAENLEEFAAARAGEQALTALLEPMVSALREISPSEIAASLGDLVAPVDVGALQRPEAAELAEHLADSFAAACRQGIAGWRDDDLAFVRPWEFDLASIRVPVAVWQGAQDRMVPFEHGRWLADHVEGARAHLEPDEGHISLVLQLERTLEDLARLAS